MDYKECKFYENGECTHKEAPSTNKSCIGYDACAAKYDNINQKAQPVSK